MHRRDALEAGLAGSLTAASPAVFAAAGNALRVRWMFSSGPQRAAMVALTDGFRAQAPVVSEELEQSGYKADFAAALRSQPPAADVMLWFGGERLRDFARQGLLEPLSALARTQQWSQRFGPALMSAVQVQGETYGLPLSTYTWGFFYRRSVFNRLGLEPPRDGVQLQQVCEALRAAGLRPFVLGGRDLWPVSAWFSQLSLRLHGLEFHRSLLAGQLRYDQEPRVRQVFTAWQLMLRAGYFGSDSHQLDWRAALPYVSRGLAGMVLAGGFAALQFPTSVRSDLGFFRYPTLNAQVLAAEEAPLDVLVVPRGTTRRPQAFRFLSQMAEAGPQARFNAAIGLLPPHQQAERSGEPWVQEAALQLQRARGVSQFFDRDCPAAFAQPAMAQLLRFVQQPEQLDAVLAELERLRLKHYQ